MKLSETQRAILSDALSDDDPNWILANCVYKRNLQGLVNAGAIAHDDNGHWYVTDEARVEMESAP